MDVRKIGSRVERVYQRRKHFVAVLFTICNSGDEFQFTVKLKKFVEVPVSKTEMRCDISNHSETDIVVATEIITFRITSGKGTEIGISTQWFATGWDQ